jgi:bacterioferritin
MRGDEKVIGYLNAVLKGELTAINQYFMHYRILDNWGVKKLAKYEYHESIDEMKHADKLMERILFLDGLPNLQTLNRLRIGENVLEILKADLELEYEALALLKEAIPYCESVRDFVSRELFVHILEAEEEHVDFIETQLKMIEDQGLQNYIQLQSEAAGS